VAATIVIGCDLISKLRCSLCCWYPAWERRWTSTQHTYTDDGCRRKRNEVTCSL